LNDPPAFVTGASAAIGEEIAVTLADYVVNVSLAARSDGIYETAERIDEPSRTLAVETDVTDEANVRSAIEETDETFGGLEILVNKPGSRARRVSQSSRRGSPGSRWQRVRGPRRPRRTGRRRGPAGRRGTTRTDEAV
jgi:NADP-dependent 3-hydroxy acid dehydrogenase YdfG